MRIFLTKNGIQTFLTNLSQSQKKTFLPFSSSNRWFFDETQLLTQIEHFNKKLHWIKPYYAMKSNPNTQILKTLISSYTFSSSFNKIGLDAASISELILAKKFVSSDEIIYTNPHTIPHEQYIMKELFHNDISLKVVDNICEIEKMVKYDIKSDILIRLNSNNNSANVKFDSKFGSELSKSYSMVNFARENGIKVKGVSFHIGSGGEFSRKQSYKTAFEYARPLLEYSQSIDTTNNEKLILDIGGGLLYDTNLEDALGWTEKLPYTIIAELGRYYSEPSYHLATQIIAKTERGVFLDNGVYHELNVYHRDHWNFPKLTHYYDDTSETINEVNEYENIQIFGPTCDSYDTINECTFPLSCDENDWIFLHNMGAYTSAGKVDFNGIKGASSDYTIEDVQSAQR
jgi:ornithine decarboxylase